MVNDEVIINFVWLQNFFCVSIFFPLTQKLTLRWFFKLTTFISEFSRNTKNRMWKFFFPLLFFSQISQLFLSLSLALSPFFRESMLGYISNIDFSFAFIILHETACEWVRERTNAFLMRHCIGRQKCLYNKNCNACLVVTEWTRVLIEGNSISMIYLILFISKSIFLISA